MIKGQLTTPTGPHISQKNLSRFEPVLSVFLATYPGVATFTPTELAPTTFAARFRDAVNAALSDRFEHSLCLDTLRTAWTNSVCVLDGDTVRVGPKAGIASTVAVGTARSPDVPFLFEIHHAYPEELNALALLYSRERLPLPTKITGGLPPGWIPPPNVACQPQGDYHVML